MIRKNLPARRSSVTFDLTFWDQPWQVTVGYYDMNQTEPGEVFVNASRRAGADLDVMTRDASILMSLALQHGVPLETIAGALTRNPSGGPGGIMGAIADRMKVVKLKG